MTTEGGLDAAARIDALREFIRPMRGVGSRVSLFIDAEPRQIEAACRVEAAAVEFHTGSYCDAHERGDASERDDALERIRASARMAAEAGLEVHAGHGLPYDTVAPVAAIEEVAELNIGHFLIGESIFVGLDTAVREMRRRMHAARAGNTAP